MDILDNRRLLHPPDLSALATLHTRVAVQGAEWRLRSEYSGRRTLAKSTSTCHAGIMQWSTDQGWMVGICCSIQSLFSLSLADLANADRDGIK